MMAVKALLFSWMKKMNERGRHMEESWESGISEDEGRAAVKRLEGGKAVGPGDRPEEVASNEVQYRIITSIGT